MMHRPKRLRLKPSQYKRYRPETSFCDLDVRMMTWLQIIENIQVLSTLKLRIKRYCSGVINILTE